MRYSQAPVGSRPTPRRCTRLQDVGGALGCLSESRLRCGRRQSLCRMQRAPRVTGFLLRRRHDGERLAVAAGEDKALVKPNMALYRKRWGPTNRPIKGRALIFQPPLLVPVLHLSPISATRRQRPRSSLALALILGGRLTRLAVLRSLLSLHQLTLSAPHARHAQVTSHHDAPPIIPSTPTPLAPP